MAPYLGPKPNGIPDFPPQRRYAGSLCVAAILLGGFACLCALAAVPAPSAEMAVLCDPWK